MIVCKLEEWRTSYKLLENVASLETPADFYATSWPCYKEAIKHGEYFLSVEELQIFARLAGVNVVITTYHNEVFQVAGNTMCEDVPSNLIYVSMNDREGLGCEGSLKEYGLVLPWQSIVLHGI